MADEIKPSPFDVAWDEYNDRVPASPSEIVHSQFEAFNAAWRAREDEVKDLQKRLASAEQIIANAKSWNNDDKHIEGYVFPHFKDLTAILDPDGVRPEV